MSSTVFCLMGPTAIGKTDLACELSKSLPLEIINVDSSLMYKELNIGAAKPSQEVLKEFPHHLVNCCDLNQVYSVAQFCEDVQTLIPKIQARGRFPLLVGGTMMYFKALQQGLAKLPEADESIRKILMDEVQQKGLQYMHDQLQRFDPESANRLHPNDYQRVLRAHEIYRASGISWSEWLQQQNESKLFEWCNLALLPEPRSWLHERISLRLDQMIQEGFLEEVKGIMSLSHVNLEHPALRSVGYRQAIAYLHGQETAEEWPIKALYATRQLAKRQITWLRSFSNATFLYQPNPSILKEIIAQMKKIIDNSNSVF